MNRIRIRRSRIARPRFAAKEKGKGWFDWLELSINILVKMCVIFLCAEFTFLGWHFWQTFSGTFDTTAILAAVVILASAFIIWAPKLQVMRLNFASNTERFNAENEARKTIATLVGGLAILVSFYTAQRQLGVQQQAQFTDRYTKAIDEIAASDNADAPKLAVRVGGLYVLEQIMDSSEAQHASIMEVLCSYIRENSSQKVLKPTDGPRSDTFVALTILGRRHRDLEESADHKTGWRVLKAFFIEHEFLNAFTVEFARPRMDLSGSDLAGADLSHLVLSGADLSGAKLSRCRALFADLSGVRFAGADLSDCVIASSLDGASFDGANLEGAVISGKISNASFQGADVGLSIWIGAELKNPRAIMAAKNWEMAFYNSDQLSALGLPADHNVKLFRLISSRVPNTAIQLKVRLTVVLQALQKLTDAMQTLRDEVVAFRAQGSQRNP